MDYFIEDPDAAHCQGFRVDHIFHKGKTQFQEVFIFDNEDFGRVLALDGYIQTTQVDEFIYHEMLAHVPLMAHPDPKRVLIVGGGDGGITREVCRHRNIEEIVQVEIDEEVLQLCTKYLPEHSAGAFNDPRLSIIFADAFDYIKQTDKKFDVIINDSTDPVGPGEILFTREFYTDCKAKLDNDGIFVNQNDVISTMDGPVLKTYQALSGIFNDATFYTAHIPSFIGGVTMFAWGCDNTEIRNVEIDILEKRFSEKEIKTLYYSPEIHKSSFALPPLLKDTLGMI